MSTKGAKNIWSANLVCMDPSRATNQGLYSKAAVLIALFVFIPGHVFVVAYSDSLNFPFDRGMAIECTAITKRAVEGPLTRIREEKSDAPVTFDEANKLGEMALAAAQKDGKFILVHVKELQAMGYVAPELADIDTDKLTETLRKRLVAVDPNPPEPVPPTPAGLTTWLRSLFDVKCFYAM